MEFSHPIGRAGRATLTEVDYIVHIDELSELSMWVIRQRVAASSAAVRR
jgi:hypothetical protein